ncbi:FUSC family protein [Kitasatospora sp. GP82]|uniref:FUSC family protein n=1 Tax=Kitasatospora sp. GP82 TaxID=3035089 RepID=UPI00247573D5|nr:FUSC family protein [Kitasatospora sp. GP82]MDH6124389.1 putative membrane protein YccC [Kitasatospora sp. GP82]
METSPGGRGPGPKPGSGPVRRLLDRNPDTGPVARRAGRVTVAACAGFYPCLYGLHQPVTATYALFSAVAMGALSRIPGTGRQRAAVILRALPIGWVLVAAGTVLAVSTWAAAAGMLAISFVLAFAAVAGPRPAGAVPGLHLLYILPCFPPFAPATLGQRLIGTTLGVALLAAAEALLFREPPPVGYRALLAGATRIAGSCAVKLADGAQGLGPEELRRAHDAGEALSPAALPPAERPAGPGRHDRALAHAGGAVRQLLARLSALPPPPSTGHQEEAEQRLLSSIGETVGRAAAALGDRRLGPPAATALDGALEQFRRSRIGGARNLAGRTGVRAAMLRQASLLEAGEAARTLLGSVTVATGRTGPAEELPGDLTDGPLWFARLPTHRLWLVRLTRNLSGRSVYFQNAVRTSIGLAAARAVTGVVALPHGFWVMLAALTLTRTSTAQTRTTVRRALIGTVAGAMAAAVLLVAAGQRPGAYAVALPVVMLAAFLFGPLLGVGWAQGLFTLVVATVFAQLAPASWQLAEARLLDVLTGSLIGLLCGLFAWPHGAHGQLRRDIAAVLRGIASTITGTVLVLTGRQDGPGFPQSWAVHVLSLAEASFAQCQSEPDDLRADRIDWQAALIAGQHALRGSRRLLGSRTADAAPGEHGIGGLYEAAGRLAGEYLSLAERLEDTGREAKTDPYGRPQAVAGRFEGDAGSAAAERLLLFDTGVWLQGLALDLRRIATTPPV